MKLLVAGSRTYLDYGVIARVLDESIEDFGDVEIIHGGARGVDHLAKQYCKDRNLAAIEMKADWARYKKRAGSIRNGEMAKAADHAILFWDGKSSGTKDMLTKMQQAQKPYVLFVNGQFDHEQSVLFG